MSRNRPQDSLASSKASPGLFVGPRHWESGLTMYQHELSDPFRKSKKCTSKTGDAILIYISASYVISTSAVGLEATRELAALGKENYNFCNNLRLCVTTGSDLHI